MSKISMYCITLDPKHLDIIKKINYIPVGLGNAHFSEEWMNDSDGENIASKNKFYGEYTFHYWIWKNHLNKLNNNWIGFCQYRKFWLKENITNKDLSFDLFNNLILKKTPEDFDSYESILGEQYFVNTFRFSKFIKRNFKTMFFSPSLFFRKDKRNIKFHFDMMHGHGNIDRAIRLLDSNDQTDFKDFINTKTSINPHNMFICKSKEILKAYYDSVFPWLKRCESEFGFEKLEGYGLQRIYGFLAERYMSYWFQKNTKFKTLPILFKDVSDF